MAGSINAQVDTDRTIHAALEGFEGDNLYEVLTDCGFVRGESVLTGGVQGGQINLVAEGVLKYAGDTINTELSFSGSR